jgi:hypothetical protein
MKTPPPVLDYPSVAAPDGSPPLWQVVVARTFSGLFGLLMLLPGLYLTVSVFIVIWLRVPYHFHHPADANFGSDVFETIVLILLAVFCDWVAVRWISYALRGRQSKKNPDLRPDSSVHV